LTELGWETLGRAAPLVFAAEKELFAAYSADEVRRLADLLKPVISDTSR
jgi:orotidine-5'-phosphate decarboxylase